MIAHLKKLLINLVIAISFILSVIALILCFVPKHTKLTAGDIFQKCIYSVVELKAFSGNVGESFGTAEIISADGKIVTNAHVVTYSSLSVDYEFEEYYIRFSDEENYIEVKLLKYDLKRDLALLKIVEVKDLVIKPIKTGDTRKLNSGDNVYAVGNALNYGIGIYSGIISIPLLNIEIDGSEREVIQCDLTIAAGNSGGALLNANGELIGLTTFRTKDKFGKVIYGIAYCIPVNIMLEFTNE